MFRWAKNPSELYQVLVQCIHLLIKLVDVHIMEYIMEYMEYRSWQMEPQDSHQL